LNITDFILKQLHVALQPLPIKQLKAKNVNKISRKPISKTEILVSPNKSFIVESIATGWCKIMWNISLSAFTSRKCGQLLLIKQRNLS